MGYIWDVEQITKTIALERPLADMIQKLAARGNAGTLPGRFRYSLRRPWSTRNGPSRQYGGEMTYFLVVAGALALGGLPFPGTLRMASRAEGSYRASLVIGFTPATYSRCMTVFGAMPKISAISEIVIPSIDRFISEIIQQTLDFSQQPNKNEGEFANFFIF
jgi:hypothetical protein